MRFSSHFGLTHHVDRGEDRAGRLNPNGLGLDTRSPLTRIRRRGRRPAREAMSYFDLERAKLPELLAYAQRGQRQRVAVGLELLRRKELRLVKREVKGRRVRPHESR